MKQFDAKNTPNRRPAPQLSDEDRRLWKRVADTTTPLSEQRGQFLKHEMAKLMEATSAADDARSKPPKKLNFMGSEKSTPPLSARNMSAAHPIEERVVRDLGRGRHAIDARIDLHGMTQDRARYALLDFLQMAQRANYRIVLVITGKGDREGGILRTNVPRWLSLPVFAPLVNGYRQSNDAHGGPGALYVRIRKLYSGPRT
jgi:DNA-nicking Smr family endonuclease